MPQQSASDAHGWCNAIFVLVVVATQIEEADGHPRHNAFAKLRIVEVIVEFVADGRRTGAHGEHVGRATKPMHST